MVLSKAEQLVEKGQKLMAEGNFGGAARAFAAALREAETVPTRNNLAYSLFMAGKPEGALEALQPAFEAEDPAKRANPFTYALASRICCSLGREEEARRRLNQAVRSFEAGLAEMRRALGQLPQFFREYTVIIMRAAADLKDHRQVLELYRRWEPYHLSWENKFLAGVACFNLGRYQRAANLWSSLARTARLFADLKEVALRVEAGSIPPFEMSYDMKSTEEIGKMLREAAVDEEARRHYWQDGFVRMMLLSFLLREQGEDPHADMVAHSLVLYTGEWGEKLGWEILKSPGFSSAAKMGAAQAFVERGLLKEGEPVRMYIGGEERLVELRSGPVMVEPDEELDAVVEEALALRDQGRVDEAIALLEGIREKGIFYARAMMVQANLLRRKGELEKALSIMQILERVAPEDPAVLLNFAALMVQMDRPEEARARLRKIGRKGLPEDFLEKLKLLEEQIEEQESLLDLPRRLMYRYQEEQRRYIEEKTLPVDPPLARGLKNLPANWLEAAGRSYGLEPARRRPEREKQLMEFLCLRQNLERVAAELEGETRELLKYLLAKGGWSKLNAVTRKFGSMEGDGFYWEEEPPKSPLGVLWSRALVMVGKAAVDGKRARIATIPVELRQPLKEILG